MRMNDIGAWLGSVDLDEMYRRATAMKEDGNCVEALPLLQILSRQGPGYEGAQQALGECLLELAGESVTDQLEAVVWLRRAAEGGRAEAQGQLALVYLSGPQAVRNVDEALFWYALYRETPARGRFGFTPLAGEDEATLSQAFDGNALAQVADAVAVWQPTPWLPPKEPMLTRDRDGPKRRTPQHGRHVADAQ